VKLSTARTNEGSLFQTVGPRWFTCPQTVTHPSTNRARRIETANALPQSHTATR